MLNHKGNLRGTIAPPLSNKERPPQTDHHQKFNHVQVDKDTYKWCKKKGHYQKDCPEFLKHLMRKGEDIITCIDESLYLSYTKSTWWIDSV